MKLSEKVNDARNFALKAHGTQMYGVHPFSYHLDSVHAIVKQADLGIDYEIASYLHDVVEDTDVTKEEIAYLYGNHIAEMVWAVTGVGKDRKEKHQNMKDKMIAYPLAVPLKMGDRLVNMRSSKINRPKLYEIYVKEHNSFYDLFVKGNDYIMKQIESVLNENTNTQDEIGVSKILKVV